MYHSTVGSTPIGMPLLPIQLIEAGTLLVLFAVQLFLFLHRHRTGRNTVFYFFAYPVVRFVLEFFRGDAERGKLLGLSTSQWGSVLIIGILMAVIIIRRHRSQNAENTVGSSLKWFFQHAVRIKNGPSLLHISMHLRQPLVCFALRTQPA